MKWNATLDWKNMPLSHKIATVISGLAIVVWMIYKVQPNLLPFDPTYPAIAVFTLCEAVIHWKKKRTWAYLLIAGAVISIACSVLEYKATTPPEITVQSLYDATNVPALLEKHDSVYVQRTDGGEAYEEEYFSKEYRYFYDWYDPEDAFALLSTDHSYYMCIENMDTQIVILTPDGMVDMESYFAEDIVKNISMSSLLNDIIISVTEKDGQVIVTSISDQEELDSYEDEGWILGEEEHVLDGKTHELISVKGSYTIKETGEVRESVMTVTYDGEIPESMKKFLEYDQQTENLRTITIVSNPGAANEKTESIQVPKGLQVAITYHPDIEGNFDIFADAACTQTFTEEEWDVNSDLTAYVKWGE